MEQHQIQGVMVNRVYIESEAGAKALEKPKGCYVTIDIAPLWSSVEYGAEEVDALAEEIRTLLPQEGVILVVGLGNSNITPDALGPKAIGQILATRHIPDEVKKEGGLTELRAVAALATGVLGQTGIESGEIIHSVVEQIQPAGVIVIDALAAKSVERLGRTIQIANSGISPGSGVMNRRKELSQNTLGVPVVSIGIPTVVDAVTVVWDMMVLNNQEREELSKKIQPGGSAMMVTPREVDQLIERGAKVLSMAVNRALQPSISAEDLTYLLS